MKCAATSEGFLEFKKGANMTDGGQRLVLDLLGGSASWRDGEGWEPFRAGVDIRRLYQASGDGPTAFLLRYQPGASVPLHEHLGYEHILVLDGAQSDERGRYPAGTLVVNPPGSTHQVCSDIGCVVLIVRDRGVCFYPEA